MGKKGDIDHLLLRNCFIIFPDSYESVNRYLKIVKIKSVSCPKNVIFAHAHTFENILFADPNFQVKCGHAGSGVDLGRERDIYLLPPRICFIMFPLSYETVDRYIKVIKIRSGSFISAHAQSFESILIC